MKRGISLTLAIVAGLVMLASAPQARAGVNVQINIGTAPVCPYGYYDAPPYQCAPYGYYGPEWFAGEVFVGAGPWFHGPADFRGRVDRDYGPGYYKGPYPNRGEKADWKRHRHHKFRGGQWSNGRGHANGHHKEHKEHGQEQESRNRHGKH